VGTQHIVLREPSQNAMTSLLHMHMHVKHFLFSSIPKLLGPS
jgi:hypothetical protein